MLVFCGDLAMLQTFSLRLAAVGRSPGKRFHGACLKRTHLQKYSLYSGGHLWLAWEGGEMTAVARELACRYCILDPILTAGAIEGQIEKLNRILETYGYLLISKSHKLIYG